MVYKSEVQEGGHRALSIEEAYVGRAIVVGGQHESIRVRVRLGGSMCLLLRMSISFSFETMLA